MRKERYFRPRVKKEQSQPDLSVPEEAQIGDADQDLTMALLKSEVSGDSSTEEEISGMDEEKKHVPNDDPKDDPTGDPKMHGLASLKDEEVAGSSTSYNTSRLAEDAFSSESVSTQNTSTQTEKQPDSSQESEISTSAQPDTEKTNTESTQGLLQIGYDLFKSQILPFICPTSENIIKYLHRKYFNRPNYLQLASNEFFAGISDEDASANTSQDASQDASQANETRDLSSLDTPDQSQTPQNAAPMMSEAEMKQLLQKSSGWRRYIGTLDVEAWATRPFWGRLKYLQPLEIRRLRPRRTKKMMLVQPRFGDSAVIRLYTMPDGREIGRLREDITRILCPLIDLGVAEFEAFVIMNTLRSLSIGDSFYLLIRCYLNNNTFTQNTLYEAAEELSGDDVLPKRRKTTSAAQFNFALETEGEAVLRLKQKSIARLFERLHITKVSPETSKYGGEDEVIDLDTPDPESSTNSDAPTAPTAPTEELNLDQLKQFYLSNQQQEYLENLPDTTTPPEENFALLLRPYQKHGLAWMLSREKEMDMIQELSQTEEGGVSTQRMKKIRQQDEGVMDPLWNKFHWPKDRQLDGTVVHHDDKIFYANLYNGEFSLEKPIVKTFMKGGILADEMGLGKTILTLALIHSVPYDVESAPVGFRNYAAKTTLIIVPMSLLSQWKSEFDRTNNNSNHCCYVYYGDQVQTDLSLLLCKRSENIPIVVVTTYGIVQSEWTRITKMRDDNGRLPKLGLFSVEFFRIVLDEGHTIRNRTTKTAKAVHELELRRKWLLTGTPVVNRLDDIFSLVKFLRLEPWGNFSYWKTFVTQPFEEKKFQQTLDVVKTILQPIFLRRTKNMKQKDGTPLVSLPDKEIVIEELDFSEKEQLYYDFFKSKAYQSFKEGMRTGDLLRKYSQILLSILRLRQVCCHLDLIAESDELDASWKEELASYEQPIAAEKFELDSAMRQVLYSLYKSVTLEDSECSICTLAPIAIGELTVTECGHQYCLHCLLDHIKYQKNEGFLALCPQCRHPISKYRLFKVLKKETSKKEVRFHTKKAVPDPRQPYPFQLYYYNPDRSSAKIQALIRHLRKLKEQSPGEQVVVFLQFSTFLDLIENEINGLGTEENDDFVVYKFDGRLSMVDREKTLKKFTAPNKADGKITILLLSLKAGGVGLNLTVAKRAFMMDPWWSPSIEDQAIDRIHRIGQEYNVKVVRFIVKNSIEEKMLRIQERKRKMGEAVEVEEEERRKQRIEEIKLLFDE